MRTQKWCTYLLFSTRGFRYHSQLFQSASNNYYSFYLCNAWFYIARHPTQVLTFYMLKHLKLFHPTGSCKVFFSFTCSSFLFCFSFIDSFILHHRHGRLTHSTGRFETVSAHSFFLLAFSSLFFQDTITIVFRWHEKEERKKTSLNKKKCAVTPCVHTVVHHVTN